MTNNDDEQTYNTNAAGRRLPSTAWKPGGPSPNPAGRGHVPSKFSKKFLVSLAASWEQHGDAVFEEVRRKDVVQYLRICASLIPKEVLVITPSTTPAAQLSEPGTSSNSGGGYFRDRASARCNVTTRVSRRGVRSATRRRHSPGARRWLIEDKLPRNYCAGKRSVPILSHGVSTLAFIRQNITERFFANCKTSRMARLTGSPLRSAPGRASQHTFNCLPHGGWRTIRLLQARS
jgi:hypothetical protein